MDEQHHILIKKVKKLVSTQNYTPPTPPDGGTVEMNPIDAWNGIEIVSSIGGSLPASETWTHIVQHQFPEELTEVGVVYEKTISTSGSAGGVNVPQIGMNSWELSSEANASATVRAVPYSTIKAGYSGPVKASTTRSYYSSPPLEVEIVTLVIPVYGTIIVSGNEASLKNSGYIRGSNGVWLSSGGANGGSAGVVAVRHQFGPVLHNSPGLTTTGEATVTASQAATSGSPPFGGTYPVSVASVTATLEATLRLPACSHTPFVTGNTLIVQVLVEKWRFGVWIKEVTTITHP